MDEKPEPRLMFQIHFNWPKEQTEDMYKNAKKLHELAMDRDWIKDVSAASGAVGNQRSSFWIFTVGSYGALDQILLGEDEEFSKVYFDFFTKMEDVVEYIYNQVHFL